MCPNPCLFLGGRIGFTSVEVDPGILRDILLLVVGTALGLGGAWARTALDERRRRRSVATALCAEYFRLRELLRYVINEWGAGKPVGRFRSDAYDRFLDHAELFDAVTVARVIDFAEHLNELRRGLEHYPTIQDLGSRQRFYDEIRGFAPNIIAKGELARESLIKSGAIELKRGLLRPPLT